jgi:hypothetical protein
MKMTDRRLYHFPSAACGRPRTCRASHAAIRLPAGPGRSPPPRRDEVKLGGRTLTARWTPGHTKGCTTWTFDATDRGRTYKAAVVCGLTVLEGTRVSGMASYPTIESDYERTFEVLKRLPGGAVTCSRRVGPHRAMVMGLQADSAEAWQPPLEEQPLYDARTKKKGRPLSGPPAIRPAERLSFDYAHPLVFPQLTHL